MDINKREIKQEQEQAIGIIPVMNMKAFVTLLLANLASNPMMAEISKQQC